MRKPDRLCDDLTNCRRGCLVQMVLFPPFLQDICWLGVTDHSLCESLKTLDAGKQSKVTTSLSHLGPVENPCISSWSGKTYLQNFSSCWESIIPSWLSLSSLLCLQQGLFLQRTPHPPLSRWIKLCAENLIEGFFLWGFQSASCPANSEILLAQPPCGVAVSALSVPGDSRKRRVNPECKINT